MSSNHPILSIAIAGGGIAGLALGAGLHSKHPHIDFHVYEAAKAYQDVGGGLAIHKNGISAMNSIDPALTQSYSDSGALMGEEGVEMSTEIIAAQGRFKGEVIGHLGRAKNRKTVSRADLLEAFSKLIPHDKLTFNKRFKSIEQTPNGIDLTFEDGSQTHADCLIGADGIHSRVRPFILGPDHPAVKPVNSDNWHIYRAIVPMEEALRHGVAEKWATAIPILVGNAGYFNSLPLSKGTRLAVAVCAANVEFDQDGNAPPLDPERFRDYIDDARDFATLAAGNPMTSWITADHDPAPTYFDRRVAMIGDAAHATHQFNGQGAAQALEDVAVLHHLFARLESIDQIEALFSAFEKIRLPRSQKVAELSRKFGRIYEFREGDLHEDLEKMRAEVGAGAKYTNEFDIDGQNEEAMRVFEKALEGRANGDVNK